MKSHWFFFIAFIWLALTPPAGRAAPITSNTALPVSEGELLIRAQASYLESTGDLGPLNRELSVWAFPTVFVYGATEKLTLFGIVPFIDKNLRIDGPTGRLARGDTGLADIRLLTRYTLGQWDGQGETRRFAVFAGLELPTGEDGARDGMGQLPAPLQLGSGSWDPLAGLVFTWQTLAWELDASASWKFNTAANGYQFGDEARLNVSFQTRLWPRELGSGVPGFLYGVVESNLIWRDRSEFMGSSVSASGGTAWYLAPGLQYVTERWILEAAIQLPVAQNLNGGGLESDFIATAGVRFWF